MPGELNSDQLTRLYQNKRKCVEREERRVAQKTANEGANGGAGEETWDMKAAARNQIFSSKGAFTRLSTELFALQERMDPELAVDAVDHDVYVWDVKFMGGFDPGSGLAEDLETLEAVNGYGYVQLRLHFMADLYPFYPPRVELVRPNLAGIIPGAMTAHPRLHPATGSPSGRSSRSSSTSGLSSKNSRAWTWRLSSTRSNVSPTAPTSTASRGWSSHSPGSPRAEPPAAGR